MVKPRDEVVAQFNEQVNMSVEELEAWLADPQSAKAGTGVGVESGHKIVEILKKNPTKDPEKYDEEDIEHMRKVVGYNSRHMAQEDHLKDTKTKEELEKTKSTISMKNWGHDPVKTLGEEDGAEEVKDSGPSEAPEPEPEKAVNGKAHPDAETTETKSPAKNGTSKRKFKRDADPDEAVDGAPDSAEEDAGYDSDNNDEVSLNGEGGAEQRPRKKSKTAGVSASTKLEEQTTQAQAAEKAE